MFNTLRLPSADSGSQPGRASAKDNCYNEGFVSFIAEVETKLSSLRFFYIIFTDIIFFMTFFVFRLFLFGSGSSHCYIKYHKPKILDNQFYSKFTSYAKHNNHALWNVLRTYLYSLNYGNTEINSEICKYQQATSIRCSRKGII